MSENGSPRWVMTYADKSVGDLGDYVVISQAVFHGRFTRQPATRWFDSKSRAITEAQRLNGYEPVDGSEQTYSRQLAERGLR